MSSSTGVFWEGGSLQNKTKQNHFYWSILNKYVIINMFLLYCVQTSPLTCLFIFNITSKSQNIIFNEMCNIGFMFLNLTGCLNVTLVTGSQDLLK